jgi:acyl dehydratase
MARRLYEKAPAVLPLYGKALLPALPGIGALPGVRHASDAVPDLVLERKNVSADPAHLRAYREVCGFGLRDTLPVTYPHLHAFALHMALMTDTRFPFPPMGLVHLRNTIVQHRPIGVTEPLSVAVHAADLRPHPKGRLVDVVSVARTHGETVWEETTTLFARGSGRGPEEAAPLEGVAPPGAVRWRLPGDLGRRYAAVSGDRNPIHLYPLTAKAFGFPRNIAHGMWTKARCLAALENRLPDAFRVDVEFRKPVLLPTTVVLGSRTSDDRTIDFGVRGERKPVTHLVGRVTPL